MKWASKDTPITTALFISCHMFISSSKTKTMQGMHFCSACVLLNIANPFLSLPLWFHPFKQHACWTNSQRAESDAKQWAFFSSWPSFSRAKFNRSCVFNVLWEGRINMFSSLVITFNEHSVNKLQCAKQNLFVKQGSKALFELRLFHCSRWVSHLLDKWIHVSFNSARM